MSYTIKKIESDGDITGAPTFNVVDGSFNLDHAVALVGKNQSSYGQLIAQNQVRMLQNFASDSPPTKLDTNGAITSTAATFLTGQIWYDTSSKTLQIYQADSGTSAAGWGRITTQVTDTAPTTYLRSGTKYFDTTDNILRVYDENTAEFFPSAYPGYVTSNFSTESAISNPSLYGTRLRTIFLKDDTGASRAVQALVYVSEGGSLEGETSGETVMAIFSPHANFTPGNVVSQNDSLEFINYYEELTATGGILDPTSGITEIRKGLNLRFEYAETSIPTADFAETANIALRVDTGIGGIVDGDDIIYLGRSLGWIPASGGTTTLGNSTNIFNTLYVQDIVLGNGGTGTLSVNGNVDLGGASDPVNQIFVTSIDVDTITGNTIIGTSVDPVSNVFTTNLTVTGTAIEATQGIKGNLLDANGNVLVNYVTGTANVAASSLANALTRGTGLVYSSGTTFDGSSAKTLSIDTSVVVTRTDNQIISGTKTFSSQISATSGITDGTATLASGALSGVTTISTSGDVTIGGDLTVNGTTTTIDTVELKVSDNIITLNSDFSTGTPTENAGIEIRRGALSNVSIRWNESSDDWEYTTDGNAYISFSAADTLGGIGASSFLRSDVADTHSGNITPATTNTVSLGSTLLKYSKIYANEFLGDLTGVAQTAENVIVLNANTTNSIHYPLFVSSQTTTGQRLKTDNGYTYNPSSGTLTATIFSGTATTARYADLAEIYETDEEYLPGTVMMFGGDREVTASTEDATTKVLGVISTNPAYLMNNDAPGQAVALKGRVPCFVKGPVEAGDFLVASDEKGVARASKEFIGGAIIGKAIRSDSGFDVRLIEIAVGIV